MRPGLGQVDQVPVQILWSSIGDDWRRMRCLAQATKPYSAPIPHANVCLFAGNVKYLMHHLLSLVNLANNLALHQIDELSSCHLDAVSEC